MTSYLWAIFGLVSFVVVADIYGAWLRAEYIVDGSDGFEANAWFWMTKLYIMVCFVSISYSSIFKTGSFFSFMSVAMSNQLDIGKLNASSAAILSIPLMMACHLLLSRFGHRPLIHLAYKLKNKRVK